MILELYHSWSVKESLQKVDTGRALINVYNSVGNKVIETVRSVSGTLSAQTINVANLAQQESTI